MHRRCSLCQHSQRFHSSKPTGSSNARSLQQISRDAAQLAEEELAGLASLCSKRLLLSRPASRAAGLASMELS